MEDNLLFGVFGGYAGTTVGDRLNNSHANINAGQVGLYQVYRSGRLYLTNTDAYSGGGYQVNRAINFGTIQRTANGSSFGNQWAHYTEAGVTLGSGRYKFQPFTGLQYIYLNQQGYSETGAGSLDLTTSGQTVSSVRGNFGGRISAESQWNQVRFISTASARYQREFGDGTQLISSSFAGTPTTSFVTAGNNLGRDFGLFSLGGTALLTQRSSIFGSVDTQVAPHYNAVMGSLAYQYCW
jgi:subtilase-type serine protease